LAFCQALPWLRQNRLLFSSTLESMVWLRDFSFPTTQELQHTDFGATRRYTVCSATVDISSCTERQRIRLNTNPTALNSRSSQQSADESNNNEKEEDHFFFIIIVPISTTSIVSF
jgi:hypothetical protein